MECTKGAQTFSKCFHYFAYLSVLNVHLLQIWISHCKDYHTEDIKLSNQKWVSLVFH